MRLAAALLALLAAPAAAHEFWIAPLPGTPLSAHVRVGEDLAGDTLSYRSDVFRAIRHWPPGEGPRAVPARLGDSPAIAGIEAAPGLHRLAVETEPAYVVFDTMEAFRESLLYEGLDGIADAHRARGLPEREIAEGYLRHARALVQFGPETAPDAPLGLAFELVLEGSPFEAGRDGIDVTLLWEGAPAGDVQVALFHRAPGAARAGRVVARTDAAGRVRLPFAGPGDYLANAVRMDPVEGPGSVRWWSHWASTTWTLP